MSWRLAKSLDKLRRQVNAAWPERSKSSDGTIGDRAHSARKSDHNPDADGVVCAIDITHDPANGCDAGSIAETLRTSRDRRIKYLIFNRRICSGADGPHAWRWRKYSGSNGHTKHIHISVAAQFKDDTSAWDLPSQPVALLDEPKEERRKPLIKSKIAGGAAAVGTAETVDAGNQISDALDKAQTAKDVAEGFGLTEVFIKLAGSPRFWLAVVTIIICAAIVYWRWRDHGRGGSD